MTSSSRRSGFRLPWTSDEPEDGAESAEPANAPAAPPEAMTTIPVAHAAPAETGAHAATTAPASAEERSAATDAADGDEPDAVAAAEERSAPIEAPAAVAAESEGAGENRFLRSLVDAMCHVAEETRSKSVLELRTGVDDRIRGLRASSEERASAMRKLAEEEIAAVATWQETEIERIHTESKRRSEERRTRLDLEIDEDAQRTETEIDQTKRRATEYEAELDAFLVRLADIDDPARFVVEAQRMPPPPSSRGDDGDDSTVGARLAARDLDDRSARSPVDGAAAPGRSPTLDAVATPSADAASPAESTEREMPVGTAAGETPPADVPPPVPEPTFEPGTEAATSIVVKGLGSFGAITSFKQSLERAPGIRSVALSLGPTGEFVYRATHAAETDLPAALSVLEEGCIVERQPDDSLRVTVGRPR